MQKVYAEATFLIPATQIGSVFGCSLLGCVALTNSVLRWAAFRYVVWSNPTTEAAPIVGVSLAFRTAAIHAKRVTADAGGANEPGKRRRPEHLELVEEPLADPENSPEELLERRRARAMLDSVLAELPIDLRAVFVLYELERLTASEIAVALELAPGTVASRLRRAREMFEARVQELERQMQERPQ